MGSKIEIRLNFDGFAKVLKCRLVSFPPRLKCGINYGGNPVFPDTSGCLLSQA
jgi:hypothetical protein